MPLRRVARKSVSVCAHHYLRGKGLNLLWRHFFLPRHPRRSLLRMGSMTSEQDSSPGQSNALRVLVEQPYSSRDAQGCGIQSFYRPLSGQSPPTLGTKGPGQGDLSEIWRLETGGPRTQCREEKGMFSFSCVHSCSRCRASGSGLWIKLHVTARTSLSSVVPLSFLASPPEMTSFSWGLPCGIRVQQFYRQMVLQ